MRIGSLFSGAGGLDMAVEKVFGRQVVWQSEIDKAASKVLAHRWPGVPNLGSITEIDWATVEPVDVLCGGFPCQDVSAAGKRAGIKDGTRSGLWAVFAEAIDALRPQYVVIENVRGLLSAAAHRTVEDDAGDYLEPDPAGVGDGTGRPVLRAAGAVLGDLADLGYDAVWATVAAADVGAPHRRERVFIVATTADARVGSGVGLQQQDLSALQQRRGDRRPGQSGMCPCGNSACGADAAHPPRTGRDEGRAESARLVGGFDAAISGDEPGVALLPTPRNTDGERRPSAESGGTRPSGQPRQKDLNTVTVRELRGERGTKPGEIVGGEDHGAVPVLPTDGGGDNTLPVALNGEGVAVDVGGCVDGHNACVPAELAGTKCDLLPTPAAADGQRGQDFARAEREGSGGDDLVTLAVKADRDSAWGKYSPAIARWQAVTRPAPAPTEPNKNGNPRLSAAFSEWLMGWPAGWVTDPAIGISRNDQLRIVGNGVCSQQAAAALRYLLAVTE